MIASSVSYGTLIFLNSSILKVFVSTISQLMVLRELALVSEKVEYEEKVKSPNSIWFSKEQYRSLYWKDGLI